MRWKTVAMAAAIVCWGEAVSAGEGCDTPAFAHAAAANSAGLDRLVFEPFGKRETGWRIYAPLVAAAIGTKCDPASSGFAAALGRWQRRHRIAPADGRFSPAIFAQVYAQMQAARPFVRAQGTGCPPPPAPQQLSPLRAADRYGRPIDVTTGTALAWHRLRTVAARELPEVRRDPRILTVYSGYRSPDYDDARCLRDGNCDGRRRAQCSPHSTGTALDIYLGPSPALDSTAYENRRILAATPAYRWLVANGPRFGFVNYAFEPWHWEWTGETR